MSPVRAVIRSGHLESLDTLDFPEGTNLVILPVTNNEGDHKFWMGVADNSLARIWDNPEDDVYAELLKE